MRWLSASLVLFCAAALQLRSQTITTVAGNGTAGYSGDTGSATQAKIDTAYGVAVDSQGNVFFSDTRNHRVRKIVNGVITTVAGTGQEGSTGDNGPGTSAQLSFPRGLAFDTQGNLYIADSGNSRIRKLSNGTITTYAGNGTAGFAGDNGPATSAEFSYPRGLAFDSHGNLVVADSWNFRVRSISPGGANIQTIAGNGSCGPYGDGGPATAASLGLIDGVAFDNQGNLYISDVYQHIIRKVGTDGSISTAIGGGFGAATDGIAATATLKFPKGLAADNQGNLFIADTLNQRVRWMLPNGVITSAAGTGAAGYGGDAAISTAAQLDGPYDLAVSTQGNLYLSDLWNYRIREVTFPPEPVILSVLNAAGAGPFLAPGAYAQISGINLSTKTDTWSNSFTGTQLPTQVDGVSVSVGGTPAYVSYVSPGQINIIVPNSGASAAQVKVTTGSNTSAPFNISTQQYSPAFFLWGTYAVATHPNYSYCAKAGLFPGYSTTPAKPEEWITLWANGFGPTDVSPGILTPSDQPHLTAPVTATVGGVNAQVYGGAAVLTAGNAGLYQITVQIPAGTADGDVEVRATIGGVQTSSGVYLTVHH